MGGEWIHTRRSWRRVSYGLALATFLTVGLSAAQLLPTFELTLQSIRTQSSFENATAYPMTLKFLLSLFNPFVFGNPAEGNYNRDTRVDGVWWENVLYVGLLPLLCVLTWLGTYLVKKRFDFRNFLSDFTLPAQGLGKEVEQKYYMNVVSWGIVFFFYLSLGSFSVLFLFLYYILPGMKLFRFPTRFNLFVVWGLALLYGWSL